MEIGLLSVNGSKLNEFSNKSAMPVGSKKSVLKYGDLGIEHLSDLFLEMSRVIAHFYGGL